MYQYWLVTSANRRAELRETSNEVKPKEGEVSVEIQYTTMNYKDALAILGKPGVIRKYALVPGIDFWALSPKANMQILKQGMKFLPMVLGWAKANMAVLLPSRFLMVMILCINLKI